MESTGTVSRIGGRFDSGISGAMTAGPKNQEKEVSTFPFNPPLFPPKKKQKQKMKGRTQTIDP